MSKHAAHHVPESEQDAILRYAIDVLQALGLTLWVVQIATEPCEEDANATVDWMDTRYVATIALNENWMEYDDQNRRNTITHEIFHLVHARVSEAIDDGEDLMRFHEWEPYRRRVQRELELMVDHFSTFMANTHKLADAWAAAYAPSTGGTP